MEKRSKAIEWIKDSSGLMEKRWYAYALAGAGALVATAPAAHATIVSSGALNETSTASCTFNDCTGAVINVNMDGLGDGQFGIQAENNFSTGLLHFLNGGGAHPAGIYTNGGLTTPAIPFGTSIGPAGAGFSYVNTNHTLNPSANWKNGDAFVGLQFFLPSLGANVYGWAELNFTGGTTTNYVVTLEQYAYQDNGTDIMAGDTGLTPEPGTAGLLLLGMGAVGLAAWRKRKQAQRAA